MPIKPLARLAIALLLLVILPSAVARPVPNLELKDLAGHPQKLSSLRGQIVVLSFWATWCGPCLEELPRLTRLNRTYAGKNVRFIAISLDEKKDRPKIQPFLAAHNIDLEVWVGGDSDLLPRYGLDGIVPATLILDPQGEPISRISGEAQDDDLRTALDWLLAGRSGPAPSPRLKRY
jgi:thiol-disulfide isomerase/thioredoxin